MRFQTKENEEIVHIIRPSILFRIPKIAVGILFFVGPFFFFFPLLGLGFIGVVTIILFSGAGLWFLGRQAIGWRNNMWIVTTERLVELEMKGYFNRRHSEAPWKAVADIAYRSLGLFSVIGLGSIRVRFHGVIPPILISPVRSPKKLYNLLVEVRALPSHIPHSQSTFTRHHLS